MVAEAIIWREAITVNDGFFKNNKGTSAIVQGADREKAIISLNKVAGNRQEQSAYHSELAGITASVTHIKIICSNFDIQEGKVKIGMDGEASLNACSQDIPIHANQQDYDLIQNIRNKVV